MYKPSLNIHHQCSSFIQPHSLKLQLFRTEDRKPEWFASPNPTTANASLPQLPTEKMFEDEQYWYPHFFAGKRVIGRVEYAAPEKPEDMVGKLRRYWFGVTT